MAEIKSTLELVMEKTRNMTLSEEERRAQRIEKLKAKIIGTARRFCNHIITEGQMREEFSKLKAESCQFMNDLLPILREAIPLGDTGLKLAKAAGEIFQLDIKGLEDTFQSFNEHLEKQRTLVKEQFLEHLQQKLNLSGSALEVNIEKLAQWRHEKQQVERQLRQSLFKGN